MATQPNPFFSSQTMRNYEEGKLKWANIANENNPIVPRPAAAAAAAPAAAPARAATRRWARSRSRSRSRGRTARRSRSRSRGRDRRRSRSRSRSRGRSARRRGFRVFNERTRRYRTVTPSPRAARSPREGNVRGNGNNAMIFNRGEWVKAYDPMGNYGGPYARIQNLHADPRFESNMANIYGADWRRVLKKQRRDAVRAARRRVEGAVGNAGGAGNNNNGE